MAKKLTRSSMVLLALYRASGGGTSKVPYEELVLQAWRDFPQAFSLRNHPEHPDASDIHKKLYQSLRSNGFVISLGNKCFRLTEAGVAKAEALDRGKLITSSQPTRLSREEEAFIRHGKSTRAFVMWQEGAGNELIDHDARLFFGYGVSTPPKLRRQRAEAALSILQKACGLGVQDADVLRDISEHLTAKFLGEDA